MYNNIIFGENISIRFIDRSDLHFIFNFYRGYDKYKFAFGLNKNKIFTDIIDSTDNQLKRQTRYMIIMLQNTKIGIIKISFVQEYSSVIWINFFALEESYQHKRFGSISIGLLEKYFTDSLKINSVCISVVEGNTNAYNFWIKNGYIRVKTLSNKLIINDNVQNVIILKKELK